MQLCASWAVRVHTMPLRFNLWPAITLTLFAALPATAQVRGRVVDATANPLPGALVELWSSTTRLAGLLTDQRGEFHFTEEVARPATLITVRRVGYQPARLSQLSNAEVTITLVPFARILPTLTVTATLTCPNIEDRTARGVWEAMRHRYQPFRPDAGASTPIRSIVARVSSRTLGAIDTTQATDGAVAAGRDYFTGHTQRVAERGYAIPYQGVRRQRIDHWEYPLLESFFAGHFMDSLFGTLHHFSVESRSPLVLRFCPRNSKRPTIQGRLEFDADTSLARATWVFTTPEPQEEAGGEVVFAKPASDAKAGVLLPLFGLFWRKVIYDYYQEWMEFRAWRDCRKNPDPLLCR